MTGLLKLFEKSKSFTLQRTFRLVLAGMVYVFDNRAAREISTFSPPSVIMLATLAAFSLFISLTPFKTLAKAADISTLSA